MEEIATGSSASWSRDEEGNLIVRVEFTEPDNHMEVVVDGVARHVFENMGLGNHGTKENPIVWEDLDFEMKIRLVYVYTLRTWVDAMNSVKLV